MLHRLLLLGLLFAFVGCQKGIGLDTVFCDVTGHPWHPEKGCKQMTRNVDWNNEWSVGLVEEIVSKQGMHTFVLYACPRSWREFVSFCHTIQGLAAARMKTIGCYRYGWKRAGSSFCYNATAVWHDLGTWPEKPIELDVAASASIQWLVKYYLDRGKSHSVGHEWTVARPKDFKYNESWIPTTTSTTTTTTTTEPEPTESEEDKLRHQLAIEQADAAYYRFMLLFISFAVAVVILGSSHYIKYRTVVKAQRLYGPHPTVNKTPPNTPAPKPEEPPKSVYVPPSSNDTPL